MCIFKNVDILKRLQQALDAAGKEHFVLLLSEIFPEKLALFSSVGAWIQVACPRLSIDWGKAFEVAPLLNPYEAHVALQRTAWRDVYPMDFYAKGSGPWTNYHVPNAEEAVKGQEASCGSAGAKEGTPCSCTPSST